MVGWLSPAAAQPCERNGIDHETEHHVRVTLKSPVTLNTLVPLSCCAALELSDAPCCGRAHLYQHHDSSTDFVDWNVASLLLGIQMPLLIVSSKWLVVEAVFSHQVPERRLLPRVTPNFPTEAADATRAWASDTVSKSWDKNGTAQVCVALLELVIWIFTRSFCVCNLNYVRERLVVRKRPGQTKLPYVDWCSVCFGGRSFCALPGLSMPLLPHVPKPVRELKATYPKCGQGG